MILQGTSWAKQNEAWVTKQKEPIDWWRKEQYAINSWWQLLQFTDADGFLVDSFCK